MDCLFCKIAKGEMSATIVYEDDKVIAFDDIYPRAPIHKLIIPKKHIATLNDLKEEDKELVGHMHIVAAKLAKKLAIADSGYRTLFNCNVDAGQAVFHVHMHLLGGRKMHWPPG